jgi:signal transduction histidine kinase
VDGRQAGCNAVTSELLVIRQESVANVTGARQLPTGQRLASTEVTFTGWSRYLFSSRALLSSNLHLVPADRVQLQQVILNLFLNAIEAMSAVGGRPHELVVGSGRSDSSAELALVPP